MIMMRMACFPFDAWLLKCEEIKGRRGAINRPQGGQSASVPTIHRKTLKRVVGTAHARLCPPYNARLPICPTGKSVCAIRGIAGCDDAFRGGKIGCAEKLILHGASGGWRNPVLPPQNSLFTKIRKRVYLVLSRLDERGVRVVTNVERDAVDASAARDEQRPGRTAKACGPGPPMLGSSRAGRDDPRGDGGKKSPVSGESTQ